MNDDSKAPASRRNLISYVEGLERFGRREAYIWRDGVRWRVRTYEALHRRILSCSARLRDAGLETGGHVLIVSAGSPGSPEAPDWVEALLATIHAGGVAVPIEAGAPGSFVATVAGLTNASLLIGSARLEPPQGVRLVEMGSWGEHARSAPAPADVGLSDRAQVIFTSGTTARPKGVVLTHGNIISDFAPIERGALKREHLLRLAGRLGPLRMLSALPLSHMFGQAMNVFLPLPLGLTIVLVPARPGDIMAAARRHGAWGLFTVPRVMELLILETRRILRERGALESFERRLVRLARLPWYLQALAFRSIRRLMGWRFRFFVVGGAALPEPVQQFWERCGCLVVQGYGLTETAPIVSLSNPFDRRRPNVGRPLSNLEVRLSPEGEVWVRGPNVMQGYLGSESAEGSSREDGWLRTGDVGELDDAGRLRIRGRIKDVIVTPEGDNVHPPDVEQAFRGLPGVMDVCVVGLPTERGEQVHAVLLMAPGADAASAVAAANLSLMTKQRVRGHSVWPEPDFPRSGIGKVRKGLLRDRLMAARDAGAGAAGGAGGAEPDASNRSGARRLVARIAGVGRIGSGAIPGAAAMEQDLGLASLDLVELSVALEEEYGLRVPEAWLSSATVDELDALIAESIGGLSRGKEAGAGSARTPVRSSAEAGTGAVAGAGPAPARAIELPVPRWARRAPVRMIRRMIEELLFVPFVRLVALPRVSGLEHLDRVDPPVLFVANHRSHFDGGLFKTLLPRRFRGRIAPGMTARHHRAFFSGGGPPARYALEWAQVRLIQFLFHAWPIPESGGLRESLAYAGELADAGYSLLIFPEGRHVEEGRIAPFRPGIGMFARELRMPVVPACLDGTARVFPPKAWLPRIARTRLILGHPLHIAPEEDAARAASRIERAVHELAESAGPL